MRPRFGMVDQDTFVALSSACPRCASLYGWLLLEVGGQPSWTRTCAAVQKALRWPRRVVRQHADHLSDRGIIELVEPGGTRSPTMRLLHAPAYGLHGWCVVLPEVDRPDHNGGRPITERLRLPQDDTCPDGNVTSFLVASDGSEQRDDTRRTGASAETERWVEMAHRSVSTRASGGSGRLDPRAMEGIAPKEEEAQPATRELSPGDRPLANTEDDRPPDCSGCGAHLHRPADLTAGACPRCRLQATLAS